MSNFLQLAGQGKEFNLAERDMFKEVNAEITRRQKDIPWRLRKQFKYDVNKREQDYVLTLIDLKTNKQVEIIKIHQEQNLRNLESRLLFELNESLERNGIQSAITVQQDFKNAQAVARRLDPDDHEFNEEYLKKLRNVALDNIADISKLKEGPRL